MKRAIFAFMTIALAGCANGYQQYYSPIASAQAVATYGVPVVGEPQIRTSSGEPLRDQEVMYTDGYAAIGYASFNGPMANMQGAIAQAKKVGASVIVVSRKYTNTIQGTIPITMPTAETSYTNGTVNAYGSGGYASGTYQATTTTYGSQTTNIPYSINRYDQQAAFYIPLKRIGAGFLGRTLTQDEAQSVGTARAVFIRATRRESPAYLADLLPGDIITKINGSPLDGPDSTRTLYTDGPNHFTIVRRGQTLGPVDEVPYP
jgi:S1-C subfamily serine protease